MQVAKNTQKKSGEQSNPSLNSGIISSEDNSTENHSNSSTSAIPINRAKSNVLQQLNLALSK